MTRDKRAIGTDWEDTAARLLSSAGLQILARQYRCRFGEIDLIAADGSTIVFVEVRYRASAGFGGAAASITRRKQQRIAGAARHFIMCHGNLAERPMRMDVVTFQGAHAAAGELAESQWIRGAFDPA